MGSFLILFRSIVSVAEVVREKVKEKTGLKPGGFFVKAIGYAANKLVTDETVVASLATNLKDKIEAAVAEMGISATVSKVFQQGWRVIILSSRHRHYGYGYLAFILALLVRCLRCDVNIHQRNRHTNAIVGYERRRVCVSVFESADHVVGARSRRLGFAKDRRKDSRTGVWCYVVLFVLIALVFKGVV